MFEEYWEETVKLTEDWGGRNRPVLHCANQKARESHPSLPAVVLLTRLSLAGGNCTLFHLSARLEEVACTVRVDQSVTKTEFLTVDEAHEAILVLT